MFNGNFDNEPSATLTVGSSTQSGSFSNTGFLYNNGTVNIGTLGVINNGGHIKNYGNFVNYNKFISTNSYVNYNGSTLKLMSGIMNASFIANLQTPSIQIASGANLTDSGVESVGIDNLGSITVNGVLTLSHNKVFTNKGTISNGGLVSVAGPFSNDGTFQNGGQLRTCKDFGSGGTLNNLGVLIAGGAVKSKACSFGELGILTSSGIVDNYGELNVYSGALFNVAGGSFSNKATFSISDGGNFVNFGVTHNTFGPCSKIMNRGNITNAFGGTINIPSATGFVNYGTVHLKSGSIMIVDQTLYNQIQFLSSTHTLFIIDPSMRKRWNVQFLCLNQLYG